MQVTRFAIHGNVITAFTANGNTINFGKNFFEKWMQTNDKLQWPVEDESMGVDFVKITVDDFWQAHESYKCKMIEDYLKPPPVDNSCFASTIVDVLTNFL